jgi:hypothetical protein
MGCLEWFFHHRGHREDRGIQFQFRFRTGSVLSVVKMGYCDRFFHHRGHRVNGADSENVMKQRLCALCGKDGILWNGFFSPQRTQRRRSGF